ncbi:hypothetical protein BaRGS_00005771 [Batillaria attramentaria]|uniref:Uncharacterized protein n=1 Tax=Batillaria attramentaria TaxID=370345 RepID=A0ABD0LV71_9CAEN
MGATGGNYSIVDTAGVTLANERRELLAVAARQKLPARWSFYHLCGGRSASIHDTTLQFIRRAGWRRSGKRKVGFSFYTSVAPGQRVTDV